MSGIETEQVFKSEQRITPAALLLKGHTRAQERIPIVRLRGQHGIEARERNRMLLALQRHFGVI